MAGCRQSTRSCGGPAACSGADAVPERPHLRRQERDAVGAVQCSRQGQRHRKYFHGGDRGRAGRHCDRRRRTYADAGTDRRPCSHDAVDCAASAAADRRQQLHHAASGQIRRRNADAGLHERPRCRRQYVRAQAQHRRRASRRASHLAVGGDDFADIGPRRLPHAA